ncbi:hypothetical protein GH811_15285 [Acetobacterium malicum]|uniref:Uncharacterized protein n=1 Tax=Acetobacterium malicum TaxID=52692 RepID=A0ABR6Z0M9_9FIRM|nr:hypothetical protein [Acetobacterium malicum]MBC3900979.1 hypothetical protein [Acetobacterium malicum]
MKPNVLGYHCNDIERCERFVHEKGYLIWSDEKVDEQWLGKGMYFWDNLSNANYWKNQKKKRNPDGDHRIVSAYVNLEKFLDLTDKQVYDGVERYWEMMYKKFDIQEDPEMIYIGEKLNYLFDYVEIFKKKFKVIKINAKYSNQSEIHKDLITKKTENRPRVTNQNKTIYSVKYKSSLKGISFVDESEERWVL